MGVDLVFVISLIDSYFWSNEKKKIMSLAREEWPKHVATGSDLLVASSLRLFCEFRAQKTEHKLFPDF